jgi:hypothetical protein
MISAQDIALATVEVLENILLSLDIKSILTSAQRVSHSWEGVISTSLSLQKHIFLQPEWNGKHKERYNILATFSQAGSHSMLPTLKKFPKIIRWSRSGPIVSVLAET